MKPLGKKIVGIKFLEKIMDDFDLIIVCDGAGSSKETSSGWASFLQYPDKEVCLRSANSFGTNNWAELSPIVASLYYDYENYESSGQKVKRKVKILSDSMVTVNCGNKEWKRKANLCLWASIDFFESVGYTLVFNHLPRNSTEIHARADELAKESRWVYRDQKIV